jgi:hypothetical protein
VLFDKTNGLFIVRDRLESLDGRDHRYEALWHLDAPALIEEPQKGVYETRIENGPNLRLVTQVGDDLECRVVKGQEEPVVQGWIPSDDPPRSVRPIPCVICAREGRKAEFLTVFQPVKTEKDPRVLETAFRQGSAGLSWPGGHKTLLSWPK